VKLKNLTYLTTNFFFSRRKLLLQLSFLIISSSYQSQSIANYISNGGMEERYDCNFPFVGRKAKYWRGIDSVGDAIVYASVCYSNVPFNGFTFQWPKEGNSYFSTTFLCQSPGCSTTNNRGYFRNRLKTNLVAGKTYCVKFYVNISNPSSYGISNISAFFVDNSIDTITNGHIPLTYINPQIQNTVSNIISDTMNWVPVTNTFVANGTEKNCVIGNFKSDAATTTSLINSSSLPTIFCDILLDDVSCIPLDLPAYAGADTYCIPGNTVYIGRPQDVGIDEACVWYNITNTTTPIGNAAGIVVSPVTTSTYIVKQDICGIIKWDTVVVYQSALGIVSSSGVENSVKIFPNPVNEILTIEFVSLSGVEASIGKYSIINSLGQVIREEEIVFKNKAFKIKVNDLSNGVYILKLSPKLFDSAQSDSLLGVSKRIVINR
jgi:hypothetical protein